MNRRKMGVSIGKAQRFLAEVKWLGESEGCALLAEALGRKDRPDYLSMLSVGAYLASAPDVGLDLYAAHLSELTEDECDRLVVSLRSHCKPVEYAT